MWLRPLTMLEVCLICPGVTYETVASLSLEQLPTPI
jgi:hypothetical protein